MEVGAGVDEDVVAVVGDADGGPGAAVARVCRSGESGGGADGAVAAERGTPMEVPVPRKVRVASMRASGRCWAGRVRRARRAGRLLGGGGAGEGLGDLEEAHAELEEGAVDEAGFVGGEVALGLFGEDGEHVDALAGAHEVDLGLLAFGGGAAELHDGGHVDGLDDLVEGHRGRVVHAGVGGADGGVEAVGGGLVGVAGLLGLLGGGAGEVLVVGCSAGGGGCVAWGSVPARGLRLRGGARVRARGRRRGVALRRG